jgi:two-component system phosphate regulon sensor histidine kinase PhoR
VTPRTVLLTLVGAGLLAALLLALGVLQLLEVGGRGGASGMEAFGLAFLLGLTGIVLPVAVGYLAYRALDREIAALTAAVDASAEGGARRTFVARGRGNAGELASALTRLVSGLVDEVDQGRRESRLLQSVVGAMKEGMVVLGHDRKIRVANDAFRQLFRTPFEPAGRLLAEVVRDPAVFRELEAALPPGGEVRETLLHLPGSGRSFELRVSPLSVSRPEEPPGALILFFDVTRLEALERVRREFVADVSHELRTPLTSIKAFVENLVEERLADREESMKFLEIVRKHADRMGDLVDDLTDLSLIETGAIRLEMEPVDVSELSEEVAGTLALRARAAGVTIAVDVPRPLSILADRRRLEQVLVNLVDNGIKFNRPGGVVRITGEVREGHPRLTVEDTGVGIPSDQLEQVFHRFFRVDKARSRELGGTGLGLAIVKHVVTAAGGTVEARGGKGRGLEIRCTFPAR